MVNGPLNGADSLGLYGDTRQPRAISLEQLSMTASRVQSLVNAGRTSAAWDLMQNLHPADIGSIVASLPATSRSAMINVMSPDTLVWALRQMNPVQAGRVSARLGAQTLTFLLRQVHPGQALATLRRIPILRRREVVESLEQAPVADEILAHEPYTAGSLMSTQTPTVDIDEPAEAARESLRTLGDIRSKFTHIYVTSDGELVGQINVVDLALADDEAPVREIASPPLATISADTPAEECARLRRHYDLTQLPVVDGGRLVGISARRLLIREAILGLLHGVWLGALVAVVAIIWKQNLGLGLVLGVSMLGNMLIAGAVGAAVPLLLRRIGLDPAVASAVVVTTITDVFGFLLFLGIATAAISLIM